MKSNYEKPSERKKREKLENIKRSKKMQDCEINFNFIRIKNDDRKSKMV